MQYASRVQTIITFEFICIHCEERASVEIEPHVLEDDCRNGCTGHHFDMTVSQLEATITECDACADENARDRAIDHATRRAESGYAQ